ncbi:MAG: bifunctional DNA-formamidopyrimidine glycosylase/DNA-(apurinic or apyrimidinic site) lyase [Phycisphaera sp.]|nr:bifunctional DNA-formamidopyrimidine glycosylase/DNA-(apurinic or apyrimidinic site) lyase [Phycisphaera sp.]
MPELPEVESVKRALAPRIEGLRLAHIRIGRRDVLRDVAGRRRGRVDRRHLGVGSTLESIDRRGKQLVLRFGNRTATVVRLGMSGRLEIPTERSPVPAHRHATWVFESGKSGRIRLWFIDPRRFGGLHLAEDSNDLETRFLGRLGPEAPTLRPGEIAPTLGRTTRAIKVALLDQSVVAGVGNIYADEALHQARIHPAKPAALLDDSMIGRLCREIRLVMEAAIRAGGSTLRDHKLPDGTPGGYRDKHRVYGRQGAPCPSCGTILVGMKLAARATTFCPACQPA